MQQIKITKGHNKFLGTGNLRCEKPSIFKFSDSKYLVPRKLRFEILRFTFEIPGNSNLFDKNCTQNKPQENVKCHNSTWRKLTWMNRNWTGKLQVILLSAYISRKNLCSQTFKASSEEVIVMYSEKMKVNCMKEDVWKSFFSLTCRLASRNFTTD